MLRAKYCFCLLNLIIKLNESWLCVKLGLSYSNILINKDVWQIVHFIMVRHGIKNKHTDCTVCTALTDNVGSSDESKHLNGCFKHNIQTPCVHHLVWLVQWQLVTRAFPACKQALPDSCPSPPTPARRKGDLKLRSSSSIFSWWTVVGCFARERLVSWSVCNAGGRVTQSAAPPLCPTVRYFTHRYTTLSFRLPLSLAC